MSPVCRLIPHCRGGFEAEAAADLGRLAAEARQEIAVDATPGRGFVVATIEGFTPRSWQRALLRLPPIFTRSMFFGTGPHPLLDPNAQRGRPDRVAPLAGLIEGLRADPRYGALAPIALDNERACALHVETADTNEGRELSRLARSLDARLADALQLRRHAPAGGTRREAPPDAHLHVLLVDGGHAYVGASAAPGGWTSQLVQRGLRVTAVDNGPLKGAVRDDPLVTHLRADGLSYLPKRPVDWVVCDIVEQPSRIATLIARWIGEGHARHAIFNLKLPMKKRYDEVRRCEAIIGEALAKSRSRSTLALRHLYHDREEVTGFVGAASLGGR